MEADNLITNKIHHGRNVKKLATGEGYEARVSGRFSKFISADNIQV